VFHYVDDQSNIVGCPLFVSGSYDSQSNVVVGYIDNQTNIIIRCFLELLVILMINPMLSLVVRS
jgi:hypothetical protein